MPDRYELVVKARDGSIFDDPKSMTAVDGHLTSSPYTASFVLQDGVPKRGEDGTWQVIVNGRPNINPVKDILAAYGFEIVREIGHE